MNVQDKLPSRRVIVAVVVILVVIGGIVGLANGNPAETAKNANAGGVYGSPASPGLNYNSGSGSAAPSNQPIGSSGVSESTVIESEVTAAVSSSSSIPSPSTQPVSSGSYSMSSGPASQENSPQVQSSANNTGFIEFFSNVTVQVQSTQAALAKATAVAFSFGGYVAFSSYSNSSSIAVLRIPAENYASALSQIEELGNLTGLTTNSNDVSIQYTDLNATLQSLLTEQASLLKLENESNSLNATLLLEGQIQNVDTQINEIQSQILQTRLLITYSTITATFNVEVSAPQVAPLKLKLTATPTSGLNPLSVTFNAIVTGGTQPYIINYNFGDGTTYQGQSLIHTFTSSGTFNVTVTVTDANGNAVENYTIIHVTSPPVTTGFTNFWTYALGLLVSVVEGIIEVAVVLVPIALVVTVIILPFRNRLRANGSKTEVKN